MFYCSCRKGLIYHDNPDCPFAPTPCSNCNKLEKENKQLRELLKEIVAISYPSWEWEDIRMKWVSIQVCKETIKEITEILEGNEEHRE